MTYILFCNSLDTYFDVTWKLLVFWCFALVSKSLFISCAASIFYRKIIRFGLVLPPVDLYLISEKSIWKNQVWRTGFLVYFELDFYCLCSLQKSISKSIFACYTGSKNPIRNRLTIQFVELDFSNLIFQKSSTDG